MRSRDPALEPQPLRFVGQLFDMPRHRVVGLVAMHVDHQPADRGDLAKVRKCLKIGGFVASTPAFHDHPKVINGASDLMVLAMGDAGRHARFAVGVACLPMNVPVEVDAIFEVAV